MKQFKDNKEIKKSWCIKLMDGEKVHSQKLHLKCVDSYTGQPICPILTFHANGPISVHDGVQGCLQGQGYDPHEHNTQFGFKGNMVMIDRINKVLS